MTIRRFSNLSKLDAMTSAKGWQATGATVRLEAEAVRPFWDLRPVTFTLVVVESR